MYSLARARRPRLSETEPMWFLFEMSCYAFDGRICGVQVNVNKANSVYCIVFNLQIVPFDVHFHYIDNAFIFHSVISDQNELNKAND